MHDPAESCTGAEECVGSGSDAGNIRLTGSEEAGGGEGFVESFDKDADHATKGSSDCHGGNEDTGGDFAAVGNDDEKGSHNSCEEEREDHCPTIFGP